MVYAIVTLKRLSNAIHSYGALGCAGVVLVTISVVNGLGLSIFMPISMSAVSVHVCILFILYFYNGVTNIFHFSVVKKTCRRRHKSNPKKSQPVMIPYPSDRPPILINIGHSLTFSSSEIFCQLRKCWYN